MVSSYLKSKPIALCAMCQHYHANGSYCEIVAGRQDSGEPRCTDFKMSAAMLPPRQTRADELSLALRQVYTILKDMARNDTAKFFALKEIIEKRDNDSAG